MREIDYEKQTVEEAEQEVRRLYIVSAYCINKEFVGLTEEQVNQLKQILTKEQKEKLKQYRETMRKAFFKQFSTYKKKYAEEIKQKT